MARWPIIALLAIPLIDVVVLVYVAVAFLGGVATVALVVLTALIGLLLVRAEGRHTLGKIQRKFAAGEIPTDDLLDGGLLVAAGAFLLTPGLVTDLIGLLLVLPPTRYPIRLAVKRWVIVPVVEDRTGGLVSGGVYTFGFPGESGVGYVSGGARDRRSSERVGVGFEDEAYDLGSDAYHVDVEDGDQDRDRNGGRDEEEGSRNGNA